MSSESAPLGPVTNTTLLQGLKDADNRTVWRQYVERYRPLILRYAARLGAPEAEAEDIAQATLLAFSTAYRQGKYDRDRGRLSAWLFGIARNEVLAWNRARSKRPLAATDGDGRIHAMVAEDELAKLWQREWQDSIVAECLKLVRCEVKPETLRAFELFALEERPADEVGAELGMTPNAVFGAKRRVLQRVRELMPLVEEAW